MNRENYNGDKFNSEFADIEEKISILPIELR